MMKLVRNKEELVQAIMSFSNVPRYIAEKHSEQLIKEGLMFPAYIERIIGTYGATYKVYYCDPEDVEKHVLGENLDFVNIINLSYKHLSPEEINQLANLLKKIEIGEKAENSLEINKERIIDAINHSISYANAIAHELLLTYPPGLPAINEMIKLLVTIREMVMDL